MAVIRCENLLAESHEHLLKRVDEFQNIRYGRKGFIDFSIIFDASDSSQRIISRIADDGERGPEVIQCNLHLCHHIAGYGSGLRCSHVKDWAVFAD